MNIKEQDRCWVEISLPDQEVPVLAGQLVHNSNEAYFKYHDSYLSRYDAEIDPISLPIRDGYQALDIAGTFRDSTPDSWGRNLMRLHAGFETEMEYLVNSPSDRMGALDFKTDLFSRNKLQYWQLEDLDIFILKMGHLLNLLEDSNNGIFIPDGLLTALGGSRPKQTVEKNKELFVAKFSFLNEKWNNTRVEFATMKLAEKCGIEVADT